MRGQAQVGAGGDATLGQQADGLGQPAGAFEFDHVCTGLHQGCTVMQRLFGGGIGHKGQVRENQRATVAAFDAGDVVSHIGNADRQGAVMALQDHAQGVADQQHLDSGLAGNLGEGGVVAGQHGDFLTALLEALQGGQGYIRHGNRPLLHRQGATGRL